MEIIINKNKPLKQIQDEFHSVFPFLKLEFFSAFHKTNEASSKKNILDNNLTIEQVTKSNTNGTLVVTSSTKVSELENSFRDSFGISAQVLRKSNNLWLQTTITDSWTLSKQNQNAMEMNQQLNLKEEPEDYHEQE